MSDTFIPKVGQILYHETLNEGGAVKDASLFYLDEPPEEGRNNFAIVWIAQMEDFGNGIEVYSEATAGGAGRDFITRVATDADILSFVNVIKKSENAGDQIAQWVKDIDESEDFAPILPEEKERLKKLIR